MLSIAFSRCPLVTLLHTVLSRHSPSEMFLISNFLYCNLVIFPSRCNFYLLRHFNFYYFPKGRARLGSNRRPGPGVLGMCVKLAGGTSMDETVS